MTCFELSVSTWDTEALGRDHLSGTLRMNDVMKAGVSLQEFKLDRPSKAGAGASDVRGSQDVPQAYALFQQPWWLDAVAPDAWDEVRVERDGQILARMPFMIKRRFGLTALTRPSLTWFLGPWFSSGDSKGATLLRQQKELTLDLISQLPRYDVCRITLAPQVTNWLPFHWAGFSGDSLLHVPHSGSLRRRCALGRNGQLRTNRHSQGREEGRGSHGSRNRRRIGSPRTHLCPPWLGDTGSRCDLSFARSVYGEAVLSELCRRRCPGASPQVYSYRLGRSLRLCVCGGNGPRAVTKWGADARQVGGDQVR